jgi:hypothetical protein
MFFQPKKHAIPRLQRISTFFKRVGFVLVGLLLHQTAIANQDDQKANDPWSYVVGMDFWSLSPSTWTDSSKGKLEENANLLLPNSYTAWNYKNASPFFRMMGSNNIDKNLNFHLKVRADQNMGLRVDELNIEWEISPKLGLKAGVVEYKASWCKTYDTDSVWMRETTPLCSTPQFQDVTGGAPGIQVFTNTQTNDFVVQTQLGFYDPLILGYAKTELGNVVIPDPFQVNSNKKIGINASAINLNTGLEIRASYLHAKQEAFTNAPADLAALNQGYNLYYLGVNFPINEKTQLLISDSLRNLTNTYRSTIPQSCGCDSDASIRILVKQAEITHQYDAKNSLGISYSNQFIGDTLINYSDYSAPAVTNYDGLTIQTQIYATAWRHEWQKGVFTVLQYTHSKATSQLTGDVVPSYGHALGFRLGYQY